MADELQPDEGQGPDTTTGIFDSYLQAVPQEHREAVTGYLRDAEKNVNQRLAEASELQKTLGPYKEVQSLSAYQPEQLSELLAWHQQVTSTPEAFQDWLANAAKEAGLTPAEEQALEDAEVQGDLTREEVQKLIEDRSQAQVQPLQQQVEQLIEQQQIETIRSNTIERFAELEAETGKKYSDEERGAIVELGVNEPGDNWLDIGLDRFNKMEAMVQKRFVDDKAAAPGSPLSAGGSEAFKPTTDWSEAQKQARERWRQAQS